VKETVKLGSVLSDIAMGPFGSNLKVENFQEHGVPVIRGKNLSGFYVSDENLVFVSPEKAAELSRSLARPGEIVVTHRGTLGQVSLIPANGKYPAYLVSQSQMRLAVDPRLADARFITYWMRSRLGQLTLSAFATQTGVPAIAQPTTSLSAYPISLPSLSSQSAIASVLGSLDDKIAANIEAVRTIDCLRNTLWHRNLEDGTTAAPLSSLASFVNGGAFTKEATGTGRVVVCIAEMNSGIGNNTVRNELNVPETQVVRPGELLFSWSGTLMTKRWPYDEAIVNQHIFKVIPDHGFPLAFLDSAIEQQLHFFRMIAAGKATTMGHIKRSDLDAKVQIPVQFRQEDLRLAESLWANASALEKENIALAKTRDELLPLLMNGKISVREAEQEATSAGADIPSEEIEA